MNDATLTLDHADHEALAYVERVLERNGLPVKDVRSKPECFFVGSVGDERVGVGGVEPFGPDGLLRSVAIEATKRGRGLGTALCDRLEAQAAAEGIETLYLLTTTAADFFAARGYVEVDRSAAPPAIRASAEFDELCPATATCMRKRLPTDGE